MFYSEKKAEDFLEKRGFFVVKRGFVRGEKDLDEALKNFTFPIVMKVSGEKIVHKNILGGIVLNILSSEDAINSFNKLRKIEGFQGVMVQEQVKGEEVLIGIKRTNDFGHVVCFGAGGVNTEKLKDVSFRVFPFSVTEAERMISETLVSKRLTKKEKDAIKHNLIKTCELIKDNPTITELDINPLIVKDSKAVMVDARIFFE